MTNRPNEEEGRARAVCAAITKKGRRCSIDSEPGKRLCHVHDPDGVYQQQQAAKPNRRRNRQRQQFTAASKPRTLFGRSRLNVLGETWRDADALGPWLFDTIDERDAFLSDRCRR